MLSTQEMKNVKGGGDYCDDRPCDFGLTAYSCPTDAWQCGDGRWVFCEIFNPDPSVCVPIFA